MYVCGPTIFGIKEGTIVIHPFRRLGLRGSDSLSNFPNAFLFLGNSSEPLGFLMLKPILINLKDVMRHLADCHGKDIINGNIPQDDLMLTSPFVLRQTFPPGVITLILYYKKCI